MQVAFQNHGIIEAQWDSLYLFPLYSGNKYFAATIDLFPTAVKCWQQYILMSLRRSYSSCLECKGRLNWSLQFSKAEKQILTLRNEKITPVSHSLDKTTLAHFLPPFTLNVPAEVAQVSTGTWGEAQGQQGHVCVLSCSWVLPGASALLHLMASRHHQAEEEDWEHGICSGMSAPYSGLSKPWTTGPRGERKVRHTNLMLPTNLRPWK